MTASAPWLIAIDFQQVFGAPDSPWGAPRYAAAATQAIRLLPAFAGRTVFTRWVAPEEPSGAWVDYFAEWPFALVPESDPIYRITPEFEAAAAREKVETRTTFGKWDAALAAAIAGADEIVVAGVSTDCCVLSTALAAADAGVRVRIAADACAGASDADHERALAAMALYAPLIEITSVERVLASGRPA